jgi:malonyl-CoA O-methyltransferase
MPEAMLPDKRAVRRAVERAAEGYERSAALQREVGARLLAHLDPIRVAPARLLDLGSGPGAFFEPLAKRFAGAEIVAIDLAFNMLRAAQRRMPWWRRALSARAPRLICADAESLPLRGSSAQLVFSNLALQWCAPAAVFAECARVLETGGLMLFSTFGPDTLKELRDAFATVDGGAHVNSFVDMHDLGDGLVQAGFADPVMEMEMLTLEYASVEAIARELKAIGGHNALPGRARGLSGRHRWARMVEHYERLRREGSLPATFEVIYGHAWKGAPRRALDGRQVVDFHPPFAR